MLSVGIINDGADGHGQADRLAFPPPAVAAFAVPTPLCSMLRVESKVKQCVVMHTGREGDVTAAPAVATAWTASGHELLPAKRKTAVTAVAGFDFNSDFVDEHGGK